MVNLNRILFIRKMSIGALDNSTLAGVLAKYINYNEFQSVLNKFNIDPFLSEHDIRVSFHSHFANSCHDWLTV
jgi:hypothetical protein